MFRLARRRRSLRARTGRAGERAVARWLRRQGFRVLARRWHTPFGEVDLLVQRDARLLLVEVKATATPDAPPPVHRLRRGQRARLTRACRWTARRRAAGSYRVGLAVVGVALGHRRPVCLLRTVVHDARKRR